MARSKIALFLMLLTTIYTVTAQSYGTVPATLTRIESKLDDVSETSTHLATSTDQMGSVLNDNNKHLNTLSELQIAHGQILESMASLLEKQDKHLDDLTEQQNIQNQILGAQTDLLRQLSKHNAIQNQIMNQVLDLLQQQNEQMPVISQRLDNVTEQNTVQNQILTSMADVLQVQNDHMGNLTEGVLQQTDAFGTIASSLQNISESVHHLANDHVLGHQGRNSAFTTESVPTTPITLSSQQPTSPGPPNIAENCQTILDQCFIENYGIHQIQPSCISQSFDVVCDLNTIPGGWIVFQRRFDGSVDFYRGWEEYRQGFGDLNGEFWLGLEKIHNITRRGIWQLRVDIEDYTGLFGYAEYDNFAIGDESTNYRLNLGEYSGNAGDSLSYHNNLGFTTFDQDHDTGPGNCAFTYHGAWWYDNCNYNNKPYSNLNARYYERQSSSVSGMTWYYWNYDFYGVNKCEMKIRRLQ